MTYYVVVDPIIIVEEKNIMVLFLVVKDLFGGKQNCNYCKLFSNLFNNKKVIKGIEVN